MLTQKGFRSASDWNIFWQVLCCNIHKSLFKGSWAPRASGFIAFLAFIFGWPHLRSERVGTGLKYERHRWPFHEEFNLICVIMATRKLKKLFTKNNSSCAFRKEPYACAYDWATYSRWLIKIKKNKKKSLPI